MNPYVLVSLAIIIMACVLYRAWKKSYVRVKPGKTIESLKFSQEQVRKNSPVDRRKRDEEQKEYVKKFDFFGFRMSNKARNLYKHALRIISVDDPDYPMSPEGFHYLALIRAKLIFIFMVLGAIVWGVILGSKGAIIIVCLLPFTVRFAEKSIMGDINKMMKEMNDNIQQHFYKFFTQYLSTFSHEDPVITLAQLVHNYVEVSAPTHPGAYIKIMARFSYDLREGNEQALKKLKENYPDSQDLKEFVELALVRQRNTPESIYALKRKQIEIGELYKRFLEKDIESRKEKADRITGITIGLLIVTLLIVYLVATVMVDL